MADLDVHNTHFILHCKIFATYQLFAEVDIIDPLATDKPRYSAEPRPIIVECL